MTSYWDIVTVLAIATLMLLILDWRISSAFRRHEKREQKMYEEARLVAETSGSVAREANRKIRELYELHTLTGAQLASVADEVKMHDRRLGAVEERIMRAALVIPSPPRRPDGP